jgi:RNA polymerase sigma-70 factor (ECF subfamily)
MIARARAIDRLRARRARPDVAAGPPVDRVPSETVPLTDQLVAAEQAARVREALTSLPPEQRIALELAYFEGLTQSEIAERLATPLGTVKTRMRTALAALRRSLRP